MLGLDQLLLTGFVSPLDRLHVLLGGSFGPARLLSSISYITLHDLVVPLLHHGQQLRGRAGRVLLGGSSHGVVRSGIWIALRSRLSRRFQTNLHLRPR